MRRNLLHRELVATLLLVAAALATPSQAGTIRSGFDGTDLGRIDDAPSANTNLGFNILFGGQSYSDIWVNNNGNATFGSSYTTFTPGPLENLGVAILAPFFADVDARNANNRLYNETAFGTGSVEISPGINRNAFGITWDEVGYYSRGDDKLNTFQLVIIDRGDRAAGDWDLEFNYGQIEWEIGDIGGSGGLADDPNDPTARVGFADGTGPGGNSFEFAGSGTPGALLDTGAIATSLVQNEFNTGSDGNFLYTSNGGLLVPEPGTGSLLALGLVALGIQRRRLRK